MSKFTHVLVHALWKQIVDVVCVMCVHKCGLDVQSAHTVQHCQTEEPLDIH